MSEVKLISSLSSWFVDKRRHHPVLFWVVVMALAFALLYIPLARTEGYWGDIELYMAWTHQITHYGIHTAYDPNFVAPPNTTPGLLYPFWAIGEVFRHLWSPNFPEPWIDRTNQSYLRFMLRIPSMLADIVIAWVLYRYAKPKAGVRVALICAAAFLFNPAIIFETAYYGQTGALHSLFMLLSVLALLNNRMGWSWAALVAAMMFKPQPDIFWPLLIFLTVKRTGWRGLLRGFIAGLLMGVAFLLPFLVHGTIGQMWARISGLTGYHPMLSAVAHNFWWFISLGQGKTSDLLTLPILSKIGLSFINYRLIGLGMLGIAYILVLIRANQDDSDDNIGHCFAFLFCSFFMLATQIHENHLVPMFPLLLVAAIKQPKMRTIYVLFALTTTINMGLHYPAILRFLVPNNPDVWGGPELALPRWLNSLAQVALYVYWLVIFSKPLYKRIRVGSSLSLTSKGN